MAGSCAATDDAVVMTVVVDVVTDCKKRLGATAAAAASVGVVVEVVGGGGTLGASVNLAKRLGRFRLIVVGTKAKEVPDAPTACVIGWFV